MSLLKYEIRQRIAYITMNRPEKLNAITPDMLSKLWDAFTDLRDNPDVWLGIVTGTGRAFSVGHDLKAMSELSGENKIAFWIPAGFAHGFVSLEDHTIFTYKCTKMYNKACV